MSVPKWFMDAYQHRIGPNDSGAEAAYPDMLEKYVLAVAPGYLAMYADPDYCRPKVEDIVDYAEAVMRVVLERSKP